MATGERYTRAFFARIAQMIEDGEGEKVLMVCRIAHGEYRQPKRVAKYTLLVLGVPIAFFIVYIVYLVLGG